MRILSFCLIVIAAGSTAASPQRLRRPVRTTTAPPTYLIEDPKNTTLQDKLASADRRVARVSALYEDFRNKLATQFNWEHLLSPAPLSIAVLGDLMLVASTTLDFPINVINRTDGFQYMKYPDSFRASLVQISNSGYTAFNKAHTNMDKIRLYTMNVQGYMREAAKILMSKEPVIIDTLLPLPLQRIAEVADQSILLSLEVVSSFDSAINLTSEVLEACTATKGVKETQLADTVREKNITELQLSSTGQLLDQVKADKEKYEKMITEANQKVHEAMRSMPSGWKLIGMNLVEGLGNLVTLKLNEVFGGYPSAKSSSGSGTAAASHQQTSESEDSTQCLVQHKKAVYRLCKIAANLASHADANFTSLSSASKGTYKADRDLKDLKKIQQNKPECEALEDICNSIADIVSRLGAVAENDVSEDTAIEELTQAVYKVNQDLQNHYQFVQANSVPVPPRTPGLTGLEAPTGGRASDIAVSNARFRVAAAQEQLKMAMESADKAREQMIAINQEYIEALTKMQTLKVDEIRYEEAIRLLQEGLRLLGQLKEHWATLVRFFQQISNIIETTMSVNLKDFAALANKTSTNLVVLEFPVTLDIIYDSVMKASQASYVVHNMASLYTKVSNNYIMDNIVQLNRLIAFDPVREQMTINEKRAELLAQCTEDSKKIVELVMVEKNELIQDMQGRLHEISNEYQPIFEEAAQNTNLLDSDNEDEFF